MDAQSTAAAVAPLASPLAATQAGAAMPAALARDAGGVTLADYHLIRRNGGPSRAAEPRPSTTN